MDKVEQITYQGVAPWMLWVTAIVVVVLCAAIATVWKVVQIYREEKKKKQDEVKSIAESIIQTKTDLLADDISKKVSASMKDKFDSIDKKLDADKIRIENAEKRSKEHDDALERIEQTLDSVDRNIRDMSEGLTCMAQGTIASLNHQIHNGNKDELEEAAKEMNRYLTHRLIVPNSAK